ncbi:S8 family serine peptidase [Lentzea tibetensis]|uniref:S8 family serine peptidase n=1 Tax=Lentzea tibetensis TaxID=2591470 RepID=A0A563EJ79_9PSEU|nr:S8 family serine peptidase [Lentzea tibetensis]TWP46916.1 S8 family serine peptidase [Lentzea tibetensis]
MRPARHLVIAALAAGLVTPAAQAAPAVQHGASTRTVTLISGDKVVVDDKGAFVGTEGRPGTSFVRYVENDHQFVVPEDALPLLAKDRLDKRFFDVTALLDFGYEDAKIDHIPVLNSGFRAAGNTAKKDAAQQWGRLLQASIQSEKMWLDGRARLTLNESVPMVGAPQAWQNGLDGKGVTVAVLDTGYDQGHPELQGVVSTSKDFTGLGIQDTNGHGTHVASTVAGRGGTYTGVAKGATLAVGKVCEEFGCQESAVIAGMEWAAREAKAKVVSMSLGGDQSDGTDPLSQAVNRLTEETGALFVIAAGNSGVYRRVSSPAAADSALAVANVTKQGPLNDSSSRGPRIGDHAVKPDIAAPGTDIVAARAKDTLPGQAVDEFHARLTGTSMATPHVAGAAAILAQRNPSWTAGELKAHLMGTAKDGTKPDEVGTGLLDVAKAATQQVRADAGSLSYGLLEWPHTEVRNKTITYRNDGDQPVTLKVSLPLNDFSLSADTVTVPAHGTAPLTVILDPRKGLGQFYGYLTAEAPGVKITTAVGAYVQEERHRLTVRATGRDGKPVGEYMLLVNQTTGESSPLLLDATGVGSVKLPVADYAVLSRVKEYDEARHWYAPVSATDVVGKVSLAQDAEVVLDTRQAKPIKVDVGDSRVAQLHRETDLSVPRIPSKNTSGVSGPLYGATDVYGLRFGDPVANVTYETLLKAAQPRVSIDGRFRFPLGTYGSSGPVSGRHEYPVVLPGGDVKGALVVLQLKDGAEWEIFDHAQRLKDAGAAAVLQVGPIPFAMNEQTALPVVWATQHHAAGLVRELSEGKPVRLTLTGAETSPVSYNLFYPEKGLPAGKTYTRGPVAEVSSTYRSSGADALVSQRVHPVVEGQPAKMILLLDEWLLAPASRTEFYTAGNGIGFYREVGIGRMFGADARDPHVGNWSDQRYLKFRPGQKTSVVWNEGVSAPRVGIPPGGYAPWSRNEVARAGDAISASVSVFSAGNALEGWVRSGWGTLALSRDGQPLGTSPRPSYGEWRVPPGQGRYELALSAERAGAPQVALSTRVDTKWGFTSATSTGALPLLQVAYDIPLDIRNSARAGAPVPVKFTFPRQSGAGHATVRDWKAWASYDDGATWVPVRSIIPPGGKAGGFVSLKVTASDTDGNTVDQTVLRAYRLRA